MLWGRGYTQLSLRAVGPGNSGGLSLPPDCGIFFFNGMSLLASVYFKTARLCKINTGINT